MTMWARIKGRGNIHNLESPLIYLWNCVLKWCLSVVDAEFIKLQVELQTRNVKLLRLAMLTAAHLSLEGPD